MARKPGNGRLSRVGAHTDPRGLNLARSRENVWDLPESPEGSPFKLPETVNHTPLKIRKRQPNAKSDSVVPSSPPRAAPKSPLRGDVRIVARLANGAPRCAATSYRFDKPAGPRYEQCHNSGPHDTAQGSRCTRHARKPGPVRCEHMVLQGDDSTQCSAAGVNGTTRCAKHMKTLDVGDKTRKRKSGTSDVNTDERNESPKRTKKSRGEKLPAKVPRSSVGKDYLDPIENAASTLPIGDERNRPKSQNPNGKMKSSRRTESRTSAKSISITESSKQVQRGHNLESDSDDLEEREMAANDASEADSKTSGPFERVFRFLNRERRPGRCQTELCSDIRSACHRIRSQLSKETPSLEEVAEHTQAIQDLLLKICKVDEDNRRAVKGDMYGHVFRSLTRLLQSLHSYLSEENDHKLSSPESIRIISHFIHDILATKGWIADWKIRWNSDRMIKDVDSYLIAPLRDVETTLNKQLRNLEKDDEERKALLNIRSQCDEEKREIVERARLQQARQMRWDHWQQLHITRMNLEPEPRRRRALFITKLEELGETDANGFTFERVPVFKDRKTPPLRRTTSIKGAIPWSTEQETALIDGLQEFAGPNAYHDIFRKYCGRDELLRDFSVLDIVTKAEWIRSRYTKVYQEKGWELPGWMQQIPAFS
ncbi:hypothetical protein IQ06DRAFT_229768 [Phaeosphaeriaceae sp. SRC1lsM3a]|nr:hypothetical protein IQ06DRAFT_229768 [Stagonospora sp. SRC1lsM3a]